MKKLPVGPRGTLVLTNEDDGKVGLSALGGVNWDYGDFWWDASADPGSNCYGVSVYEGHWEYDSEDRRFWVRDGLVGTASFYSHQEAAHVYLDASLVSDFDL